MPKLQAWLAGRGPQQPGSPFSDIPHPYRDVPYPYGDIPHYQYQARRQHAQAQDRLCGSIDSAEVNEHSQQQLMMDSRML